MKTQTITIKYGAKRSYNFQTANVEAEMTVAYEEGDKICDLVRAGVNKLSPLVDEAVDAAVKRLVDDDRAMKGL